MFEKLEAVEKRYEELTKEISDPEVIANQARWQKAMKEHASIEEIVLKFREYKKAKQAMEEAEELMQDPEMKELAEAEYYDNKEQLPKLEEELKFLLIPKDPDDDKNIICEIRAGAGGEEAALFAGTLFRMYSMYAEKRHWNGRDTTIITEPDCCSKGICPTANSWSYKTGCTKYDYLDSSIPPFVRYSARIRVKGMSAYRDINVTCKLDFT